MTLNDLEPPKSEVISRVNGDCAETPAYIENVMLFLGYADTAHVCIMHNSLTDRTLRTKIQVTHSRPKTVVFAHPLDDDHDTSSS